MDLGQFAQQWVDDWNSRDVERVLSHFRDDAEFRSPNALKRVGDGVVRGKEALRRYWGPALAARPEMHFHLKRAFLGHRTISIHYGDELGRDVVETLVFDEAGKAVFGCGCYA